jgi:hypothetical protein
MEGGRDVRNAELAAELPLLWFRILEEQSAWAIRLLAQ